MLNIKKLNSAKSNKELVKLLKNGDMRAFDAIYEKYSRKLYGFVLRYLKQETDAEEIVQEVFFKIWKSRSRIDIYSSFESFLFTIAYNSTISLLRKRANEKNYLEYLKQRQQIDQASNQIDEIQYNELNEQLESLLNELTPRQKEIFRLSRYEGLSHEEIANKLNISVNTVKNHLVAALSFLKSNLDNGFMINLLFISLFLS
jgi:RNA polymerase sigma-70 factor (ECF subfamily)